MPNYMSLGLHRSQSFTLDTGRQGEGGREGGKGGRQAGRQGGRDLDRHTKLIVVERTAFRSVVAFTATSK
jgi:hypothetical protein